MSAATRPRITVVIPVKPLAGAKSRLAPVLSDRQRQALSLMLLQRALACLNAARSPLTPWVVGDAPLAAALSRHLGAHTLGELGKDVNDTLERAFQQAFDQGAQAAVYLPADLPLLQPADLDALVQASDSLQNVVLAPAPRDGGTNAILVPLGIQLHLVLSLGDSLRKHQEQARLNKWSYAICHSPGFALDLDTAEDLALCQRQDPHFTQELRRWEAFLESGADIAFAPTSPNPP